MTESSRNRTAVPRSQTALRMTHSASWRKSVSGAFLLLWMSGGAAADGSNQQTFEVRLEKNRLSVQVGAVPLMDVLEAIAEHTGAELRIRGDPGAVRPQAFTDQPLDAGIRQLVEPNGLVLTFAPAKASDAEPRLTSLVVSASAARSLTDTGAAPVRQSPQADPEEARGDLPSVGDFARGGDQALVAALRKALVENPDALRRGAATQDAHHPDGVSADRAAFASEDPAERIAALQTIGENARDYSIGPLFEVLVDDQDAVVRRAAAEILAGLGSEDALAALEVALSDTDSGVRAVAKEALGH